MPKTLQLPHHSLVAYEVAIEFLALVAGTKILDSRLRDQALRAAQGCCLNIAEAAARISPADRARVFAIARGEASEAAAAIEIAAISGECSSDAAEAGNALAHRLIRLLTGLARPKPGTQNPKP